MIRIAILDLYEGFPNQGMRGLRDTLKTFSTNNHTPFEVEEFDVRLKNEVPDLTFDIYISTGGPGDPLASQGSAWEGVYFTWLSAIESWNLGQNEHKKHVFFICHSFQLVCRYYGVGKVCARKSTSFGVFPIHMLERTWDEPIFKDLNDPFYAVDSRDHQVIEPNHKRLRELGARILCIEKKRPHVALERALMGIRFNEYFVGTQFHPEADALGMSMYLQREDKKKTVIDNHGEAKWKSMIEHLEDPEKIQFTFKHLIPNFLRYALSNQTKPIHKHIEIAC